SAQGQGEGGRTAQAQGPQAGEPRPILLIDRCWIQTEGRAILCSPFSLSVGQRSAGGRGTFTAPVRSTSVISTVEKSTSSRSAPARLARVSFAPASLACPSRVSRRS